jgi:hypothetical protein
MIHDFYENEFIKEFVIFPLNQKQSKGKLSTTGIEEVKGQTEIPQCGTINLSPNDTYYLFKYFSSIKEIISNTENYHYSFVPNLTLKPFEFIAE